VEKQIPNTMKARNMSRDQVINDVLLAAQPTKEFVTVEQVASLALFLCGEGAAQITGANLSIDGGWARESSRGLLSQPIVQQAYFFRDLVVNRKLFSLHDFQTGLGYFDDIGHARFKFCLLTLGQANIRRRGRCHGARR
jgi:hypothetical protein